MDGWRNEWINEWMNGWASDRGRKCVRARGRASEQTSDWSACVNDWSAPTTKSGRIPCGYKSCSVTDLAWVSRICSWPYTVFRSLCLLDKICSATGGRGAREMTTDGGGWGEICVRILLMIRQVAADGTPRREVKAMFQLSKDIVVLFNIEVFL